MSETGKMIAIAKAFKPKVKPEDIESAVDGWLDENITNPDSPPLDRSLSSSSAAAPADMVGDLLRASKALAGANKSAGRYNLFDKYSVYNIEGKYLTSTGAEVSNSNYTISHYIKVKPSTTYIAIGITESSNVYLAEYDKDLALIQTAAANSINGVAYTTSSTTEYIRVSKNKSATITTIIEGNVMPAVSVDADIDTYYFNNPQLAANAFYTGIKTKGIQFVPVETYTNTGVTSQNVVDTSSNNWSMSQVFGIPASAKSITLYLTNSNSTRADIVFLKDTTLSTANVVNAYGFTGQTAETETTHTIPSGAKYFSVAMKQSNATKNSLISVYCAEFDPAAFKTEVEGIASDIVAPFDDRIDALEDFKTETATYVIDKPKNVLDTSAVTKNYYIGANGTIYSNSSYSYTDYIAVTPGDKISIYQPQSGSGWVKRKPRTLCAYDATKTVLSSEGKDSGFDNDFTVGEHTYFVRISCTTSHITNEQSMIFINDTTVPETYYPYYETTEGYEAKESFVKNSIGPVITKNKYTVMAQSASMTDGQTIKACENIDNKKNDIITFYAEISTMSSIKIGHGYNMQYGAYIVIDGTNLTTYFGASQYFQHAHGLTFSHYIYAEIKSNNSGRADITIRTDGGEYTVAAASIAWGGCKGDVFATSDGSSLNNATLSCTFNDLQENVYIFGDSYVGIGDQARWPLYLINAGYTKNAIFGYGGATSAAQKKVFDNVLKMGKPNYLVWLLGMNDQDTSSEINSSYKAILDAVVAECEAKGITPILATIPNTPTANHTFKNAYVKSLGYRYVDFAAAVGATEASSSWWTGMLSNDNTHPTALGAKALYARFAAEVPEALKT